MYPKQTKVAIAKLMILKHIQTDIAPITKDVKQQTSEDMKKIRMRLCDIETAKVLQELGYDGEYSAWIDKVDGTIERDYHYIYDDWHIPCPRLDDIAYWLRDRHLLDITIDRIIVLGGESKYAWVYCIEDFLSIKYFGCPSSDGTYSTYEDALEAADKECIKIIKNQCK